MQVHFENQIAFPAFPSIFIIDPRILPYITSYQIPVHIHTCIFYFKKWANREPTSLDVSENKNNIKHLRLSTVEQLEKQKWNQTVASFRANRKFILEI